MEKSEATIHPIDETTEETSRQISEIRFPRYSLADSVAVAKAIHDKGGGYATREQLAAFLEYKSTQNGAYLARLGSAKLFGLVLEEEKKLKPSPLAHKILMPETPEEHLAALVDAFFIVPLFKAVYDEYRGKDLPEGLGLKNALRLKFKVVPNRIDLAYRALFESAETAGFFKTKGSKTQLIIPVIRSSPRPFEPERKPESPDEEGGGGGGGGEPPLSPPVKSRDDLQNEYIGTLIEVLRDKSKGGEMDQDLMERIERLLELKNS